MRRAFTIDNYDGTGVASAAILDAAFAPLASPSVTTHEGGDTVLVGWADLPDDGGIYFVQVVSVGGAYYARAFDERDSAAGVGIVWAGVAAAGGAQSITLAGSPATAQLYRGHRVRLIAGAGAGQERRITDYSAGRVATVDEPWTVAPNNATTYAVLAGRGPAVNAGLQASAVAAQVVSGTQLTAGATAGATFKLATACRWRESLTIAGLDSTGWTKMAFAVKAINRRDDDSAALALVFGTAGGAAGDGLQVSNGRPTGTPAPAKAEASLTVGAVSPDTVVTWDLSAVAMDLPPSDREAYYWELYRYGAGTADRERIATGRLTLERAVYRTPAKPA